VTVNPAGKGPSVPGGPPTTAGAAASNSAMAANEASSDAMLQELDPGSEQEGSAGLGGYAGHNGTGEPAYH